MLIPTRTSRLYRPRPRARLPVRRFLTERRGLDRKTVSQPLRNSLSKGRFPWLVAATRIRVGPIMFLSVVSKHTTVDSKPLTASDCTIIAGRGFEAYLAAQTVQISPRIGNQLRRGAIDEIESFPFI